MTKINVKHIAKLASLPIINEEEERFEAQLEAILAHTEKLSTVSVEGVEETSQVTGLTNVSQKDTAGPSLPQNEALAQTNRSHNGLFVVPVLIEEAIEK